MDPADHDDSSTTTQVYSLKLTGEGMSIDRKIDEETALDVLNLVMASRGSSPPPVNTENGPRTGRRSARARDQVAKVSLREYLDDVAPKRNPDKILAVAKYTTRDKDENRFTPDDVKDRFPHAAEKVPGNFTRDFRWAVQNDWIARLPGSTDEYYVTAKGDKALEEKFSIEVRRQTGVTKGTRGGKRKVTKAKT